MNMHLRSSSRNKGSSSDDAAQNTSIIDPTMATGGITTSPSAIEDIDPEQLPDRKLLLQILKNQNTADKKSEERFTTLRRQIKESKKLLNDYSKSNDERVTNAESTITTTVADLKLLQEQVNALETKLEATNSLLELTQSQLDGAKQEIKVNAKTMGKLDRKYERDEEEMKRC